jgi:hypothetical protein
VANRKKTIYYFVLLRCGVGHGEYYGSRRTARRRAREIRKVIGHTENVRIDLEERRRAIAVEPKRGCGYRKIGGLYLVSGALMDTCDRLPFALEVCPTCGAGVKFQRSWAWVKARSLFGNHQDCQHQVKTCPACQPVDIPLAGLLWVGEKFYTPESFQVEARAQGISKRISHVPKGLELGITWVFLAHKKLVLTASGDAAKGLFAWKPGIFSAFRPTRLEKIVRESERGTSSIVDLAKRGITPVFVPDDDPDHNPCQEGL